MHNNVVYVDFFLYSLLFRVSVLSGCIRFTPLKNRFSTMRSMNCAEQKAIIHQIIGFNGDFNDASFAMNIINVVNIMAE